MKNIIQRGFVFSMLIFVFSFIFIFSFPQHSQASLVSQLRLRQTKINEPKLEIISKTSIPVSQYLAQAYDTITYRITSNYKYAIRSLKEAIDDFVKLFAPASEVKKEISPLLAPVQKEVVQKPEKVQQVIREIIREKIIERPVQEVRISIPSLPAGFLAPYPQSREVIRETVVRETIIKEVDQTALTALNQSLQAQISSLMTVIGQSSPSSASILTDLTDTNIPNDLTIASTKALSATAATFSSNLIVSGTSNNIAANLGISSTSPWGALSVEHSSSNNSNFPAFVVSDQGTSTPSLIVMNATGRVGVGTTSPGTNFAVQGTANIGKLIVEGLLQSSYLISTSTTASGFATSSPWGVLSVEHITSSSSTTPVFVVSDQGTSTPSFIVMNATGYVGIGTTSPWAQFSIDMSPLVDADTPAFVVGDQGTSSPALLVNWQGNVGIGTANPFERLTVQGSIAASSTIYSYSGFKKENITRSLVTVDSNAGAGVGNHYVSIAIAPDGLPIISYYDGVTNLDLKVTKCGNVACSLGNITTTVDSTGDVGDSSSIAIAPDGLPVIAYNDNTNDDLKVIKCGNTACSSGNTITTVDSVNDVGDNPSIAIAPDGLPVISYADSSAVDLKVIKCGNTVCSAGNTITTVDSAVNVGQYSSIAIAPDGLPIIAYRDTTNVDLKVIKCGNSACSSGNTTTTVDTTDGHTPSIAIAPDGLPVISYSGGSNDLMVTKCGNIACSSGNTTTTVDSSNIVGGFSSIAIAPDGLPIISYDDSTNGYLKVVKCGNSACSSGNTTTTVDSASNVGNYTAIAITPDGFPIIAYQDDPNGDLKVAKCVDPTCSNSTKEISTGGAFLGMKGGNSGSYGTVFQEIAVVSIHNPTSFQKFSISQNGAERLTIGTTSNMGIGSSTPWGLLAVEQIDSGNEQLPAFVVSDQGTSTPSLIVLNGTGRVGISTSTPAQAFSVGGSAYITGGLGVGIATTSNGGFQTSGMAVIGSILNVSGTATSTFTGGIQASSLNINSATASSTFANGIQLSAGCFRMADGSCAGASTYLTLPDTPSTFTTNSIPYTNIAATALLHNANFVFNGTNLGIGTSSPNAVLAVEHISTSTPNFPAFVISDQGTSTPSFIVMNATGVVGIGTTSPDIRLSVLGNIRSSKQIRAQLICDEAGANCKDIKNTRWSRLSGDGIASTTTKIASGTNGGPTLTNLDRFGGGISSIGDLNGDGVEDIIVEADQDDTGGTNRGAVYILFMNSTGTVSSSVKIASGTNGGPTLTDGDAFGSSVSSIGDLNGDGVEDIAVGATGDDTGGTNRGAVYILFMNSNGTVSSSVKIASGTNGGPTLVDGDTFGESVSPIGDLNEDGIEDMAVGATGDDTGGTDRGAVNVLFMNSNGTVSFSVKIASGTNGGPTLVDSDIFGISINSIGDFNGDGVEDMVVGAYGDDTGATNTGAVYILFMNSNGTVSSSVKIASGTNGGPSLIASDYFGWSVSSIGDLNGDGVEDMVVGAYGDDTGGGGRGAVYILFMNSNGTVSSSVKIASGTNGGPTLTNDDQFGMSVSSIGDLNGDGVEDIAVGAFLDDTGGTDRGAAYIIFMAKNNIYFASQSIGIGTSSPQGLLGIDNTIIGSTKPVLRIKAGGSGDGLIAISVDADDTCVDSSIAAACALNDLAELFPTSEPLEAADIAMLDSVNNGKIKKANEEGRNKLTGVISTSPAIVFEGSGLKAMGGIYIASENKAPLSLSGRVPVKINDEGGNIQVGDPITISSIAGIGKKATTAGLIVGYSMEDWTPSSEKTQIIIIAETGYWMPVTLETNNESLTADSSGLLAQVVDIVSSWLENAVVKIKELVVEKFRIGSSEKPAGIIMYDVDTKEPYCVVVRSGQLINIPGECISSLPIVAPQSEGSTLNTAQSANEESGETLILESDISEVPETNNLESSQPEILDIPSSESTPEPTL